MNSRPLQFYYLGLVILLAQLFLGYGYEMDRKDDCFMACSLAPNGFKCRNCASSRKNRLPMRFGKRNNLATQLSDLQYIDEVMAEAEKRTNPEVRNQAEQQTASPVLGAYRTMPFETRGYRWTVPEQTDKHYATFPNMYF